MFIDQSVTAALIWSSAGTADLSKVFFWLDLFDARQRDHTQQYRSSGIQQI